MNGGIVFVGLGYILEKIILSKNSRPVACNEPTRKLLNCDFLMSNVIDMNMWNIDTITTFIKKFTQIT